MARKKDKKGKSGKSKKKGGLFGWFSGGKEEEAEKPAETPDMGIPDDFNPERTFVPDYAEPPAKSGSGSGAYGDPNMPPGAEMTMVPGYADDGAGDLPPGAEMTMAPGYAGGMLPPGAEMTMAPGYAGGDLPPGAEMTMAPGYAGGMLPPGAERTMAPGYAGGPGATGADPFSFDAGDLGAQQPPGGLRMNQSLDELNPFLAAGGPAGGAPGAVSPPPVGAGADPFGPPLLDDPGPGAGGDLGEFVGERTMVDIPSDIDALAELEPTDDVLAGEELDLGAAAAAPAAPAGTRRMFQRISYSEDCVIYHDPDAAVEYDVSHGYVFAPAVPEGWSNVPPNLALLSDGCVVGRGDLDGHGTLTVSTPPQAEEGSLLVRLPASGNYDPETQAVFVPLAAAGRISWRPPLSFASEEGVTFTLPAGSACEPNGTIRVPNADAAEQGPHGRELVTHAYLGVRETIYSDGWACLELPTDAELSGGTLVLDGDGPPPPPLLGAERTADGRWQLELPMGSVEDGLSVWIPPAYPAEVARRFDPELGKVPDAIDTCTWAGVHDSLLEGGWILLTLPEGSEVVGETVRLPAPYAVTLTPELQFELTREDDGRLSFKLPKHSEVLGDRVMIPPADYTPPAAKALPPPKLEPKAPKPPKPTGRPSVPTKAKAKDGGSETTHGASSKTAKALDRFRSSKSGEGKVEEPKQDDAKTDNAKTDDAKDDAKDDDAKTDDAKTDDAKTDDAKDDAKDDDAKTDDAKPANNPFITTAKADKPAGNPFISTPKKDDAKKDDAKDDAKTDDDAKDDAKADDAKKDDKPKGKTTKRKTKKRSRGKSK